MMEKALVGKRLQRDEDSMRGTVSGGGVQRVSHAREVGLLLRCSSSRHVTSRASHAPSVVRDAVSKRTAARRDACMNARDLLELACIGMCPFRWEMTKDASSPDSHPKAQFA